ncbi:MAG TPA: YciI family protein [Actinomycetaceae bacterium]|nr:YciI family protein [Actinomycetaceae bacterium]
MGIFAITYTYDTERSEDIARLRPTHREFLTGLNAEGQLLASGPWAENAAPGALLIVAAEDATAAQLLLDDDPFYRARLITQRTVRAWQPVLGPFAEQ